MTDLLTPPKRLGIRCPANCSLNPQKIGIRNAEILADFRAQGYGYRRLKRESDRILGRSINASNFQRHLAHYIEPEENPDVKDEAPKPSDIAILDSIITAGFRNSRNWKPTIRDTLEAMKLKVSMTGQSAFEDMLSAMDDALGLDEDDLEDEIESDEAIFSPDERSDESDDELGEPLGGE